MKLQYMCLDSALDLWPPGHFALGFFASRIGRSEMECSALGFSYELGKPRNGQLAKMGSFHQSKRPDNKWYAVEVRWGIFIENLSYFLIPSSVRKNSHSNSYSSAMTVNAQDDHLTAGAWAACVWTNCSWQRGQLNKIRVTTTLHTVSFESWNWNGMFLR